MCSIHRYFPVEQPRPKSPHTEALAPVRVIYVKHAVSTSGGNNVLVKWKETSRLKLAQNISVGPSQNGPFHLLSTNVNNWIRLIHSWIHALFSNIQHEVSFEVQAFATFLQQRGKFLRLALFLGWDTASVSLSLRAAGSEFRGHFVTFIIGSYNSLSKREL